MAIEADRQAIIELPIDIAMLASLRETARLMATQYSTRISGNRLTLDELAGVVSRVSDVSPLLRGLDPRQRRLLTLFRGQAIATTAEIAVHSGLSLRMVVALCRDWVATGFLSLYDTSRKNRSYALTQAYEALAAGTA